VVLFFNSNFQYDSGKNLANIWPSLSNSFLLSSSAQQNQNAINLYATTPEHCLELTKTFTQQNNLTSAQEWLLKAIESNYAPAEYYLYQQLVADANYAPSLSESSPEYWLLKAAQDGDIDAQHEYAKQDLKRLLEVASWYQEGKFGEEKVSQAKEWNDLIVKQAKSPEDYFQLAKELAQQNNLESSEFWLLKSLGNSYAPAEYYVYQQLVTNANYAPSLSERSPEYWLLEAAQGGDIDAQHEYAKQDPKRLLDIASWYQQGKFGEEQTNQAKSWIDLASQYAKTPEIFLQLAKIYANYSPESSQLWLLKAVAQDYPPAEYYLSQQLFTHAFANLDKIPQNKTSSNYWLLKAAQGGDIDAQHEYAKQDPKRLREVASWYQQGKFGKAKINQAQEWLQLASQYTPQVKDSSDNSEQQLTDDNKSWYDSIKDWFIKVFDWIKNLFKWVIFIAGVILAIVIVVGIFAESGELGCIGVSIVIFIAMFLVSALFNWLFDKPSVKPEPLPIRQSSKFHEHKKHSKVISATEADKITDPLVAISNIQQKYQDWTSNQLSDSKFNHYLDQQYNRYTKLLTYVYTNLFNGCSDSSQLVASERQWFKFKQAKISNSNYTPLQQKTIKVLLETQRAHVLQQMKNCTDSDGLSSANNYEQDTQNLINF
ncbi:MAG: hypothetical protein RLZZ293_1377, partial [Pseudomonadota bacterium]